MLSPTNTLSWPDSYPGTWTFLSQRLDVPLVMGVIQWNMMTINLRNQKHFWSTVFLLEAEFHGLIPNFYLAKDNLELLFLLPSPFKWRDQGFLTHYSWSTAEACISLLLFKLCSICVELDLRMRQQYLWSSNWRVTTLFHFRNVTFIGWKRALQSPQCSPERMGSSTTGWCRLCGEWS